MALSSQKRGHLAFNGDLALSKQAGFTVVTLVASPLCELETNTWDPTMGKEVFIANRLMHLQP